MPFNPKELCEQTKHNQLSGMDDWGTPFTGSPFYLDGSAQSL